MPYDIPENQIAEQLGIIFKDIGKDLVSLNLTETMLSFLPTLQKDHQARFDARKAPDGTVWPEWQFMRWPLDKGLVGHQTLESSGRLRRSLMIGGEDNVSQVEGSGLATTLLWGSRVPYAAIHNFGASFTLGIPLIHKSGKPFLPVGTLINIPQREFVGLTPKNIEDFASWLLDDAIQFLVRGKDKKK